MSPTAEAADAAYTVTPLHFAVTVGPDNDHPCDITGDLYLPTSASKAHPVPAILTTNGFGGSKADQAGLGRTFASRGYAVLAYSGLGFGGSSCTITLDDPDWDGKAGKQLVSYLGGAAGIGYLDAAHREAAPTLDAIKLDGPLDPRVGMAGGSYGGGAQFATASVDPRVDAIVPMITWNDLPYSIDPNNAAQTTGVTSSTPGALKLIWGTLFSATGMASDVQDGQLPDLPCPSFTDWVCPAVVSAGITGYFPPSAITAGHHASVASYLPKIKIPTLLVQGEYDHLFNLNEAIATYKALQAQGTEVKMIWEAWSHGYPAAPGEFDLANPDPASQYVTARIAAWFDRYLKGKIVSTGPEFSYFRDWVDYTGIATPAYGTSGAFPLTGSRTWKLSHQGQLTTGIPVAGDQTFLTPAAGLPTSVNPLDVLGNSLPLPSDVFLDLPGTYAAWQTPALSSKLDVVGTPVVKLRVQAPTASLTEDLGPGGQLVLFVKIADVGPDGTTRLIKGLEAPIRIPDTDAPIKVTLPAIAHRFEAGHRLKLIVAGGSVNYRGGLTPVVVTIAAGSTQTLTVPVA
ncbi:CocE/NonD family hydrolase [Nocardioides jejuensis]|uniref:CocE/NonD family hydrolase n=1 Tax=Nocardioides jejuensis TaxID=2502782 RepID=UPI001FB2EC29|nr:CocE/NonD family hydrolase [Nocardioides jejuensis]